MMPRAYELKLGLDGRYAIRPTEVIRLGEHFAFLADGQRVPLRGTTLSYFDTAESAKAEALKRTEKRLRIARQSVQVAERAHEQAMEL